MLARIALVIAILACAGSLFFANKLGQIRDGLKTDVANLTADKNKLTADLAAANNNIANLRANLAKLTEDLNTTTANLEGTKIALSQKQQEADNLKQSLTEKATELETVRGELASANETLKKIQEITSGEDFKNIEQIKERLTAQAEENKILGQQLLVMRETNASLQQRVEELTTTPLNLRGRVAAVQDSWGFCVLDIGRDQRVQTNANFLVYRDTKLIGKLQIRTVGETTSIAEVLPEFQRGTLRVGDLVVH
jgi:DNA repair exonuclease SbcCD ATPase subunit